MVKLTEGMVIARTRALDLENVKKLNCWGSELTDVSLLRKMSNVEVLSLSVNNISTLGDFRQCLNLQELFIRKNQIKDLAEICYLRDLSKLKNLWLEDNPCAICDNYRLTVLKTLPQLQKLDNTAVQPEELQDAMLYGWELTNPEDRKKSHDSLVSSSSSSSMSPTHRPEVDQDQHRIKDEMDGYRPNAAEVRRDSKVAQQEEQNLRREMEQRAQEELCRREAEQRAKLQKEEDIRREMERREMERRAQQQKEEEFRIELERRAQQQQQQQLQQQEQLRREMERRSQAQSRAGVLFGNYVPERYVSHPGPSPETRQRPATVPPDCNASYQSRSLPIDSCFPEENANNRVTGGEDATHLTQLDHKATPTRPYPIRPKTRNSNILSAVLCLIKEMDYASLEVVEMAVRCRMDELDD